MQKLQVCDKNKLELEHGRIQHSAPENSFNKTVTLVLGEDSNYVVSKRIRLVNWLESNWERGPGLNGRGRLFSAISPKLRLTVSGFGSLFAVVISSL